MDTAVDRRRLVRGLVAVGVTAVLVLLAGLWWGGAAGEGDDTRDADRPAAASSSRAQQVPATAETAHGSWDVVAFDGLSPAEVAGQHAYVTLDENGDATGDDGCNSFFATITWGQPGELRLDSFGSTLVGCVPHTSVTGALQLVTNAVLLDPDTLHLRDAEGTTVVELRRTGTAVD